MVTFLLEIVALDRGSESRKNARPWRGIWLSSTCRLTLALGPRKHAICPIRSIDAAECSHFGIRSRILYFSIAFVGRIDVCREVENSAFAEKRKLRCFAEKIHNFIGYFLKWSTANGYLYSSLRSNAIEILYRNIWWTKFGFSKSLKNHRDWTNFSINIRRVKKKQTNTCIYT